MTADSERDRRRYAWRVLSVTSLGVLLAGANTSTLDVALPTVARHFRASATEASWMLLSYMVVLTVLILAFGRLADIVGRRRLYLGGLATLTLASLLCGLAPDAATLVALRALQAVGAAAIITNTTALLTDAFPEDLLGVGLGLNVTVAAAAQVAGPLLGGVFAQGLGWRWVFWFNVPTGLLGLGWAWLSLRRSDDGTRTPEPFDVRSALLSFVVLGSLVLALAQGGSVGWGSPAVVAGLVVFAVSAPGFVWLQRRRPYPLVDLRLFGDRDRSMAYVAAMLMSMGRFAVVLLVSLYLQAAHGASPASAGVRVLPVAAGMMVASPLAGRLASRLSARVLSTGGILLAGVGLALLAALISPDAPYLLVGGPMLLVGVGTGAFMTPNTSAIMASVTPDRRGIANGVRSMLQNTGNAVSTAVALAVVTSPLAAAEKSAAYAGTLSSLPGGDLAAFTTGYRVAFALFAVLTVAGAAASLRRRPPPVVRRRPAPRPDLAGATT